MKRKINIWSFVFSIICILLFFIYSISGPVDYLIMSTHPLKLLLFFTLINFYFGLIGFSGVKDWKGMVRSISTVLLTLGLSMFLTIVIFFGRLLN